MDEAWDDYLAQCRGLGIPVMPFSEWKKHYE